MDPFSFSIYLVTVCSFFESSSPYIMQTNYATRWHTLSDNTPSSSSPTGKSYIEKVVYRKCDPGFVRHWYLSRCVKMFSSFGSPDELLSDLRDGKMPVTDCPQNYVWNESLQLCVKIINGDDGIGYGHH